LRPKDQRPGLNANENVKFVSCSYLRLKVDRFASNRDPDDQRQIPHISSNTIHQRKCFVFVIFVCNIRESRMSLRPSGRALTNRLLAIFYVMIKQNRIVIYVSRFDDDGRQLHPGVAHDVHIVPVLQSSVIFSTERQKGSQCQ